MKRFAAPLVIGLLGAAAVVRLLSALLYEVEPWDPVTFVSVPALLLLVAFVASWLPARRAASSADAPRCGLEDVELLSPIARPPKILAVGLNYEDHIAEAGLETPTIPMIFNKQSTSVVGPYDRVHRPRASDKLDYEGELAFVIGQRCRHVPRDRARDVIAGYCVANDVSVRTLVAAENAAPEGCGFARCQR